MGKYIIKESELRSIIKEAIAEELENSVNEGRIGHALGSAAMNTLKTAALGTFAPGVLAQRAFTKTNNIINGPDTIAGTVSDFFGGNTGSNGRNGNGLSKSDNGSQRYRATREISWEYGRPETIPGFGRRTRLAPKSQITAPDTGNGVDWGDFGNHFHDEGDRTWNRKFSDIERSFIRNGSRHQNRYKRILVDWLKDRDRAYKAYIQGQN